MKWFKIEAQLPDGDFVCPVKLARRKICLIRHQNELTAVQYSCPHAGGVLAGGWCADGHIVCPIHRRRYDLKTGRGAAGQRDYIDIYPVVLKSDGIYVGLEESFLKRLFNF